jgi:ATP-dependent DNA helicase RecG
MNCAVGFPYIKVVFFQEVSTMKHENIWLESRLESRPESLEAAVLNALQNGPLSISELTKKLGHRNISAGLRKVLHRLLKQTKIPYTIPEKPNSRLQKYRLKKT